MPWLCEARHSRFRGNLETFCDGRGGHWPGGPGFLGPRSGSGTSSGGMMEAQWIPVFTGMTGGGGMGEGGDGGILTDAVAPQNPSFPRKRESRDLCDGKAGIGRVALGSWCPMGVGELE